MSGPRVIGITGYAGAGKDTVAGWLALRWGYVRIGFADALKATLLATDPVIPFEQPVEPTTRTARLSDLVDVDGWDVAKRRYPEIRALLQRLGTEGVRNNIGANTWLDVVRLRIVENPGVRFVIPDVRFDNEAAMVRELGGDVWLVDRDGVGPLNSHASEDLPAWDTLIANNGTVDEMAAALTRFTASEEFGS